MDTPDEEVKETIIKLYAIKDMIERARALALLDHDLRERVTDEIYRLTGRPRPPETKTPTA